MSTPPIFDEAMIYHSCREPTPAEVMERFHFWEDGTPNNKYMIGVEAVSMEEQQRQEARRKLKDRRRKEQENCFHGRRPYPVRWAEGTHPLGIREFYVNVEGMTGGPYLVSEGDHEILHHLGRKHEHVQTRKVSTPKD